MRKHWFYYKGQSLFEVLFAVGISALILIAVVGLSTQAVKTSDAAKNNALASKYAQEAIEWVRQKRDLSADWTTFVTGHLGSEISLGDLSDWGSPNPMAANNVFTRTIRMDYQLDSVTGLPLTDRVNITVTVTWSDSGGEHQVKSSTKLSDWRK